MENELKSIIIDEVQSVTIKTGETVLTVGKFSLAQTVTLMQFVADTLAENANKFKAMRVDADNAFLDIALMLKVFTVDEVARLVSIGVNNPDIEACKKLDIDVILEVFACAFEINDMGKLLKNAQRVATAFKTRAN
jgi:hypothetical protein